MAKYVFDSNIFINLQRRQPIDVYPSLWSKVGELMEDGTIISSQEVYDEIMIGGSYYSNKDGAAFIPKYDEAIANFEEIKEKISFIDELNVKLVIIAKTETILEIASIIKEVQV